ncbi:MAG: dTMP kinase [Candidatus Aenigmarchaeota archaeon]|nr:dTMP kinase [Candidatus Aenigmarchaeota archaeon]
MKQSFFCVLEGIDGAGTETQSKLLKEFLEKKNFEVEIVKYPDYSGPIGQIIHKFLHKELEFSPAVQFSLYATDMVKDRERILDMIKNKKVVIADRYIYSTLSYQSFAKGFKLENGLKFIKIFDLPKPNLVIFLDISPETSMKRKYKEKKDLDRHEADAKFLKKVREGYMKLAKIFAKRWVVIDGEKAIEDVAKNIQEIVISKLK